ncbi:MAG: UDP-N-acetylmuramoyl-tripeptide--D-alanyl-D-alanine ligase [Pseudomonadota bacterium]
MGARDFSGGSAGAVKASGYSRDTRTLAPGELYFALQGESFDGHDFLEQAAQAGASGAVVARRPPEAPQGFALIVVRDTLEALQRLAAWHRSRLDVKVIAITGSCGKTTTKEMAHAIVRGAGASSATLGNLNNHIGVPLTLLRLGEETRFAVVEMGCNHAGEIALLTRLADPDVGLITCVAPTHTEFLGDVDGVAAAKSELFAGLRPESTSVVNLDDPRVSAMAIGSKRKVTYGAGTGRGRAGPDVALLEAAADSDFSGQGLKLDVGGKAVNARLNMPGRHNAHNALAAAAAAHAVGLDADHIVRGLGQVRPLEGRGGLRRGRFTIIDEAYNASPAAVRAALASLDEIADGKRRVAMLGDMLELGRGAPQYHREAGGEAARKADLIVAIGDFRKEIVRGAVEAGAKADNLFEFAKAAQAAEFLGRSALLKEGDTILVKGSRAVKMEIIVQRIVGLMEKTDAV